MSETNKMDLRERLLKKLQGGNKRYPHLNATIGRARNKLDLQSLDVIKEGLSADLVDRLQSSAKFSFSIPFKDINSRILEYKNSTDEELAETKEQLQELKILNDTKKKLETLEALQKEEFSEFGTKSFAFGYPLLLKQVKPEKDEVICAPLFLWYLDITRDYKTDSVIISRSEDNPVVFNEMLDSFLASEIGLDLKDEITDINATITDDGLIEHHELEKCVQTISKKISDKLDPTIGSTIAKVPKDRPTVTSLLKDSGGTNLILNAGVFGVFRAGKQSIINDLKLLLETGYEAVENEDIDLQNKYEYTAIETDPSQTLVIDSLADKQNLIIQGPPGTGKSQTLTALITHAMANGRRTLVVCEKRTAMEIIAQNLEKIGLGNYLTVIENATRDRTSVVDKAREINEHRNNPKWRVHDELMAASSQMTEAVRTIEKHHLVIAETADKDLGDHKQILGKTWKYQRLLEDEVIDKCRSGFKKISFNYSKVEFEQVIEEIGRNISGSAQAPEGLALLPKEVIVKHRNYSEDKDSLLKYFTNVKASADTVHSKLDAEWNAYVKKEVAGIEERHNNIVSVARDFRPFLDAPGANFRWKAAREKLDKLQFSLIGGETSEIVEKLDRYQLVQDRLGEAIKEFQHATAEQVTIYENHLEQAETAAKKLGSLYGTDYASIRYNFVTDRFGAKHKEIKQVKSDLVGHVRQVNRLRDELLGIVSGETIMVDKDLLLQVEKFLSATPDKAALTEYIAKLPATKFVKRKFIDDEDAELGTRDYIIKLHHRQLDAFSQLQPQIWKHAKAQIQSLLTDYLQDALSWANAPEAITDDVLTYLDKVIASKLNPDETVQVASEFVNAYDEKRFEFIPAAIEQMQKTVSKSDAYSVVFAYELQVLSNAKNCIELKSSLNKIGQAAELACQSIDGHDFFGYYNWCEQYMALQPVTRQLIDLFGTNAVAPEHWQNLFGALYFESLFTLRQNANLLKNEVAINHLMTTDQKIKKLLIDQIESTWQGERLTRIGSFESGLLKFNSLYNKRGAPGQRRNSLRKIIDKDFRLFTALFPIVICNPETTASLYKLEKDLFDVVLFDEASQLRLEDTYTSLYRGKIKIISGDRHQMPPSDYFKSTIMEDETEYEEDEDIQALESASSESLLDYADNNGYRATMLQLHYRSEHADLIEFSNHAFYQGKLLPITKNQEYTAIEFHRIDGEYADRSNESEANFVLNWLRTYCSEHTEYEGIGIATLNINQAELIKEKIADARIADPVFETNMVKLEEKGFFVKNLENIQGDEREIILLSTAYGRTAEGKFTQFFNPRMSRRNGYRLLNVLVTRAKRRLIVATSIPDEYINKYVEELAANGKDGKAVFYAYLAYARAVSAGDVESKRYILGLLDEGRTPALDFHDGMTESPFEEEVLAAIESEIDPGRIVLQYPVGSEKFRIDMVVLDRAKQKPMLAIECDGYAYHSSPQAYLYDEYRQKILESKGFKFYRIWSTNWFHDSYTEARKLVRAIEELDSIE